jgi:hypothetical protein
MTTDMGGPGFPGYGYGQNGSDSKTDERISQPQAEAAPSPAADTKPAALAANDDVASGNGRGGEPAELGEVLPLDFDHAGPVPGFEASASDCLNHALSIARNLNHAVLSSDHLMLALTMDESGRRLLNRLGDIERLRKVAMGRLGRMHARYAAGDPSQTSDLAEIRRTARAAAAEREQLVAISDLVNAFPKEGGRLLYGAPTTTRTNALVERIEKGLVPCVSDAVTRIEAAVVEATQGQRQTVQRMLEDLNAQRSRDELQHLEFMDEIRRQVREAVDVHVAAAFRDLDDRFAAKLDALTPKAPEVDAPEIDSDSEIRIGTASTDQQPAPKVKSSWNWLLL